MIGGNGCGLPAMLRLSRKAGYAFRQQPTPAEIWTAQQLKELIEEVRSFRVELMEGAQGGGPMCDGGLFVREFGFHSRGLRSQLSDCAARD